MGCGNSSIEPTNQSTARHVNHMYDGDDDRTRDESVLSQKNIANDDAIISKLKNVNDNIEITLDDPQAFNNSLVQQRQQAINNRSYRSTIDSWQPKSLQQLAETIKSFSKGKSLVDCYWMIFYWITCNIEYDTVAYFSGKYLDQSAEDVFRTGKGVCAGYANLYKYLCNQLHISCEIVNGFSKGYGFEYRKNPPTKTDHAWNAAEIDGHWYLIESTWGAGHLNAQNAFEQKLESYYFLPRPDEMIYHHIPEKSRWQLLRTPVELEEFMHMPHLRPLYFEYQMELISPRNQVHISLLPGKSYALILLRAPSDIRLVVDLRLKDENIEGAHYIMFDKRKGVYRCYFAPCDVGKHKIMIYARRGDSDVGEYRSVLDFILDVKQPPRNVVSFPKTWKIFSDFGLEVVSPQNTHLIKLSNGVNQAKISIKAPESIELIGRLTNENGNDVKNGDQTYYDQRANIWRCQFAPDRDGHFNALIMAKKKSDPGNFTSAVSFKVEAKQIPSGSASFPYTWPLFYDLGLKIEAPKNRANAIWPENASFAEVLIQAPKDIQISCQIEQNNIRIENGSLAQFDHEKKLWQLLFAPERTGPHELLVFAQRTVDSEAVANAVVKFNLDVTKLRRPIKFPLIYTQFQSNKCQIYSPLDGIVKKGSVIPIHCFVPGAIDVNVAVDSKLLEPGGYSNSIFKRQVTAGSKSVLICANYEQKKGYDGLVQYNVQ